MTKYLVIVYVFLAFYGNRGFEKSMEYIIDCNSDADLLISLNKLKVQAIEDYCSKNAERKEACRAGIHQVTEWIGHC